MLNEVGTMNAKEGVIAPRMSKALHNETQERTV